MPKISKEVLETYFSAAITNNCTQLIDPSTVSSYLHSANRHPIYAETVLQYHPLKIHADGEFPKAMIEQRRPSESADILDYRKKTYKAITKLPVSKVINSLSKIRRSPDWVIKFNPDATPARILPEETLENYTCKHLPGYGNMTDWIFGILLKQNAIDANAVVAVLPFNTPADNEYYQPTPIIFNSDHVLEFSTEKQLAILQSRKKINIQLEAGGYNYGGGFRFYYIDDKEFIIYDQAEKGYNAIFKITHNLGAMPVFKVKGEAYKQYDNMVVNRSRLDAMVPFLDEAACEYSDYKGSKVQHLFPLFWYYQNKECGTCKGAGSVATENGDVSCSSCEGAGKVKFSPFAHIQLDTPKLGDQALPGDPAGYITRDTAILDLQDKSVDKNNYKALAAINMQFLDQTPLNISGDAKNVDREELQNFVYNFAEDLVATADQVYYWINEWRYKNFITDEEAREAMLPNIPVPQNFDLLPTSYLVDEIKKAKEGKVNPLIIAMLEEQLAAKKFYNEPALAENVKLFFDLDPLPGITIDEKMTLAQNQAITKTDFIISSYMPQFIKMAMLDHSNFMKLEYKKKMEILTGYAEEKASANDDAAAMVNDAKQKIIDEMNKGAGGAGAGA